MHAVMTEEDFQDTEASDRETETSDQDSEASDQETETSDRDSEASERDTEASDRDSEASDQYPEASDASYLQTGPARQYNDGRKASLSTVVVDVDVFAIVVVKGTVQKDLRHAPPRGRISIRICRCRPPRPAADSAA